MAFIELSEASFAYEGQSKPAVDNVSLSIGEGEYVAIVGPNGSGKSSLLRLLAGLRAPRSGAVRVAGMDASVPENAHAVRSALSLVFQSPPDQIVSTVVEEDVAFGPENLGLPRAEIGRRVDAALATVGLEAERHRPPHFLSAGQQQRLAIAGALAMGGRFIAFDEATAMLDPAARVSVLEVMDALSKRGVGILHVTHDMSEAARARRILVMEEGKIVFDGTPDGLFGSEGRRGTEAPQAVILARGLGLEPRAGESAEGIAKRIVESFASKATAGAGTAAWATARVAEPSVAAEAGDTVQGRTGRPSLAARDAAFVIEKVGFSYLAGTMNERRALDAASLNVPKGRFVALVGRTGSGKSTLLQLMDALAFPSEGRVVSFGLDTLAKGTDLRRLRTRAPLAIQRPESALFEFYAGDDVAFGPRNLGLRGPELTRRVREAMDAVGLPFGEFRDRPTRSLSGGEARRLALAGVIALDPDALLLDEPTASLDPQAKRAVLALAVAQRDAGRTVVAATHSMEEAARADLVAVIDEGRVVALAPPRELFYESYDPAWGLGRPFACEAAVALGREGIALEGRPLTVGELVAALRSAALRRCADAGGGA